MKHIPTLTLQSADYLATTDRRLEGVDLYEALCGRQIAK